MTTTTTTGPRLANRPNTHARPLGLPDPSDIADWLRRTPTHVLAELSRTIDAAVANPDVRDVDIPDLLNIAAPLRITVRRRQAQDRVSGARRALAEAGWPE